MIARDKNHPCVVMWSLGNEPDTEEFPESAYEYWHHSTSWHMRQTRLTVQSL